MTGFKALFSITGSHDVLANTPGKVKEAERESKLEQECIYDADKIVDNIGKSFECRGTAWIWAWNDTFIEQITGAKLKLFQLALVFFIERIIHVSFVFCTRWIVIVAIPWLIRTIKGLLLPWIILIEPNPPEWIIGVSYVILLV